MRRFLTIEIAGET